MTRSTGERIYRACARCRRRKVKCDLRTIGEIGRPPCVKCYNEGYNCVLADSRRGGDYSHHRTRSARTAGAQNESSRRRARVASSSQLFGQDSTRPDRDANAGDGRRGNEAGGIQNPLEALELLAKVAAKENDKVNDERGESFENTHVEENVDIQTDGTIRSQLSSTVPPSPTGLEFLDSRTLGSLLESYHNTYHAFLPLAPRDVLSSRNLTLTAREEPFVLTAVLLIATKDRPEHTELHSQLWSSMEKMLLQVVLGAMQIRTVGCVEGLLILAEWVPHASIHTATMNVSQKGTGGLAGTEDTAAWTLVGLAVRQAYLLRLDKYAFRGETAEENEALYRKRLAWTYTYIADRQISIRMGQAFWCRGPSLATKFTAADFPTLQPQSAYEDDYASVLQAQLELTVLFGNIHDLLYASKPRSISLMVAGDYTKYLDDSMQGLAAWKQAWSHLNVGQHLKLVLDVKYEYLRLYVHGFAFQAAISRAPGTPPNHGGERPVNRFPHGVLATPDGRHIHLAIGAAKAVLSMLGDRIDPTKHLRFLGPRFYLYAIHCAVFFYKAASYGAIGAEERAECVDVVKRYIGNLDGAATCRQHIAARHSVLLASLWLEKSSSHSTVSGSASVTANGRDRGPNPTHYSYGIPPLTDARRVQPHDSFAESNLLMAQYERDQRFSTMAPDSFVTGLYGSGQQAEGDFDIFSVMDFGAYGEPDLRNLISM